MSGFLRFSAFLVVALGLLSGSAFAAQGAIPKKIRPAVWSGGPESLHYGSSH